MAKFELKFLDCTCDDFIQTKSIKPHSLENKIIEITGRHCGRSFSIWLDKSTAIKFAKTLRTEINIITESEVSNA